MGKRVRKDWSHLIFLHFFLMGCISGDHENNKVEISHIVISTDFMNNLSKIDSVAITLNYSNSTSIYGALLFWDNVYIGTLQTSINNYPWSNMASISFKLMERFTMTEQKSPSVVKEEVKNKLRIQLNDAGSGSPLNVFLKDTSNISIFYYGMGE